MEDAAKKQRKQQVKMEREVRVMLSQTKGHLGLPEEAKMILSLQMSGGEVLANTMVSNLQPPNMRQ